MKLNFIRSIPISSSNLSSFSNGYVAGQLAFIANTLNCSFDSPERLQEAKDQKMAVGIFMMASAKLEWKK